MLMSSVGNEQDHPQLADAIVQEKVVETPQMDIHRLSISELQAAYARETLTVETVVGHFLARIEANNEALRAFVDIDYDVIDRAIAVSTARFNEDAQRPLEGVPVAVTADFAVSGLCHHAGLGARDDVIASFDCEVVTKLREAGAIILGTLNMDEAGLGLDSANPFCGQVVNPHDAGRIAGGAAGGTAAAVSAGLCVLAFGLDNMGGLRVPTANCGVYGYVATPHQISEQGLWPCVSRFDSVGVVARTMEDVSLVSNVLFNPDLATAMRRSRFMRLANSGGVECDMDVSRAFGAAVTELREQPSELILSQSCEAIYHAQEGLRTRSVIAQIVDLGADSCARLTDQFEARIDYILCLKDEHFAEAEAIIETTTSELRQQIASNGVIVMPTSPVQAALIGANVESKVGHFAALANVAGLPSVTIPMGRSTEGMPLGMLLVGPMGGDAMVIAQARMLNDALRGYSAPSDF